MEKPKIQEVIVVEGRYDKNALLQVVDASVLELGGFGIFNDREKTALLRALALPEHLSTAALLDVLGTLTTREELVEECNKIVANRE